MTRASDNCALLDQENTPITDLMTVDGLAKEGLESPISEALSDVQWDFPLRVAHSDIEGIHPYPAKFVAELPRALLENLPLPSGTAVLDPFCGSGTTLVESQRLGVPSYGIDLNPIACLMARVKTTPLAKGFEESLDTVCRNAQSSTSFSIPQIPNLDHWFMPQVQEALSALTGAIADAPKEHQDLLRLALSSIIVRVSNQDSDTRYAAVPKSVSAENVFSIFLRAAQRIWSALDARDYALSPTKVLQADTLALNASDLAHPIGLVITSPPYPNAYEYWLYHKYRMWWLGFDPLAVKEREIGARAHFFKRDHHTSADFTRQMAGTFDLLRQVVIPNGYVCFVVGRSKIHGQIIDNARVIEDVGRAAGFHREFSTERVVSPNRKSFNLSHAHIKTESVIVLKYGEICV
jgi:site-specific DNA-methyltransferase (cytosine-N4-specific)